MAKVTVDHDEIRSWVEERGGHPACVKGTGGRSDPGVLRIDYPGFSGEETLQEINWDEFFKGFEDNKLAFLYQPKGESRFSKLVARSAAKRPASRKASKKRASTKKATSKKAASSKKASTKKASSKKASSKKAAKKASKKRGRH